MFEDVPAYLAEEGYHLVNAAPRRKGQEYETTPVRKKTGRRVKVLRTTAGGTF